MLDIWLLRSVRKGRNKRLLDVILASISLPVLFGIALLLYWPYVGGFFALDDYMWLGEARNPDAVDYFKRAFSFPDQSLFAWPTPFWRPLVDTYFYMAWRVYGFHPAPYHVTNVLLHSVVAGLAALFVWQLTSTRLPGILTGILFVVLPTYDFAVTWISSATELFGTAFYLLTLILFTAALRAERRFWPWHVPALVSLLLALLSKESTVTLPVVLLGVLAIIRPPQTKEQLASRLRELLPFAVVCGAYVAFVFVHEYASGDDRTYRVGWHAARNLWAYVRWMSLPFSQDWISNTSPIRTTAAIGFLAIGLATAVMRQRLLAFTFGWTLLALLPYSFFPAGIEFRYTYLAAIPFSAFVVMLLLKLAGRVERWLHIDGAGRALVVLAVVLASPFLAIRARHQQVWLDTQAHAYEQLFKQAPRLCGPLPPDSTIYLLGSPTFDYYGVATTVALGLRYDRVYVRAVREVPALAVFQPNKPCILSYDAAARQYSRVG